MKQVILFKLHLNKRHTNFHALHGNLWISKALKRYFLHFEGTFKNKLLRQTTVFGLSQYLIIQFNEQILGFNNYKYSIYYKMYPIGILRDGPHSSIFRKSIAQGNAKYSKAKLNTRFFYTYSTTRNTITWSKKVVDCRHDSLKAPARPLISTCYNL